MGIRVEIMGGQITEDMVPERTLSLYVITGPDTSDYPGMFTVRRQRAASDRCVYIDKKPIGHALTLEEARELVPPGLARIDRDPDDDPVIVESWL
jgi:hypothetical protein